MISTITLNPALDKTIHIAKLAPNDTNRILKVEEDAGGKGINCSRMLKKLGADTKAITFLGGTPGECIRVVMEKEGVPLEYVATENPTRTCIAIEESAGLPPTTFNERGGPIEHKELVEFLEMAKDTARASSYVVFGGSVPLGINEDVYKVLIQIASTMNAKTVLDTDGEALVEGIKTKPFMIKPNRDEAERLLNTKFESKADVARAALKLSEMEIELVVISLGKQGLVACYQGIIYDVVPPKVKAVSTIGSGDSMIAGLLYALEKEMDIQDALRMGCAAGAATALSSGAEMGKKADVDKFFEDVKITKAEPASN